MERNGFSVGVDLLLGMTGKHFSVDTIDAIAAFLDSLQKENFDRERRRLLSLLESGATEQEMLEAVK